MAKKNNDSSELAAYFSDDSNAGTEGFRCPEFSRRGFAGGLAAAAMAGLINPSAAITAFGNPASTENQAETDFMAAGVSLPISDGGTGVTNAWTARKNPEFTPSTTISNGWEVITTGDLKLAVKRVTEAVSITNASGPFYYGFSSVNTFGLPPENFTPYTKFVNAELNDLIWLGPPRGDPPRLLFICSFPAVRTIPMTCMYFGG